MTVVLDASLVVCVALNEPLADAVTALIDDWSAEGRSLVAPTLMRYEVANSIARAIARGRLDVSDVASTWNDFLAMPITFYDVGNEGEALVRMAQTLSRRNAYDCAYILLAQRLSADLWTLDGPLARSAEHIKFPVFLVQEPPPSA